MSTPIMGDKMTDAQRAECLDEIAKAAWQLGESLGKDLAGHIESEANKLSNSELLTISRGAVQHYRAARCVLMATGPDRIQQQWQAESCIQDTKRTKKWLKNR